MPACNVIYILLSNCVKVCLSGRERERRKGREGERERWEREGGGEEEDRWMGGCLDERVDGWMDGWVNGRVEGWMKKWSCWAPHERDSNLQTPSPELYHNTMEGHQIYSTKITHAWQIFDDYVCPFRWWHYYKAGDIWSLGPLHTWWHIYLVTVSMETFTLRQYRECHTSVHYNKWLSTTNKYWNGKQYKQIHPTSLSKYVSPKR